MLYEKNQELKKQVINQCNIVEKMIKNSIDGLMEKNQYLLDVNIKELEPEVNNNELLIDELCINSIALFHPEASDLRTILMIQKINNDLERMGDLAVNISKCAYYLIKRPNIKPYENIPIMAKKTKAMVKKSITSFIERDVFLAYDILESDDIVDDLKNSISNDLEKLMLENSNVIKRSIKIFNIASYLERIADLSTNIAEDVIFMVSGKVVNHKKILDV